MSKVDTTVKLPKQLQDQMAHAESLRNQAGVPQDQLVVIAPAPGEEQPLAQPQPEPVQPSPTTPPAPAGDNGDGQTWEQRYRSLQGRFDASQRTNDQLSRRLDELDNLISTMRAAGAQPAPTPDTNPQGLRQRLVTEEEEADYGTEMLTVVGKKAREELLPEVEELRKEIGNLKGRLDGVGEVIVRDKKQEMYDVLDSKVPNWQAINTQQEFLDWLAVADPYSGRKRLDLLKDAFSRQETNRVLSFFQGFIAEASGLPQNSTSPGNLAPPLAQPGNGSGKPSLEDFAAPGRARSAPQPLSPDKPIYTSADITKFWAEKRTGKWRGREAEAEAKERDIYQAQHEGRITQ